MTEVGGKAFCDARVAELRRILEDWDDPALQAEADWQDAPAAEGYGVWARTYDTENNPLIDLDNSVLRHPGSLSGPPGAPCSRILTTCRCCSEAWSRR